MKKRMIGLVCLILALIGGIIGLWPRIAPVFQQEEIYFAAVGPLSGVERDKWQEMVQGINLYLEEANRKQIIPERTFKLLMRDDQNTSRFATKVATELVDRPEVLLVLGHYGDEAAFAAGDIYQKYGLPAITASAKMDMITRSNEWYFRVIPDSQFEGRFLASYLKNILKKTSACIIFDNDTYGSSLKQGFLQAARGEEISITQVWSFDRDANDFEARLQTIVAELRALKNPGAIFLATHEAEGAQIIRSINNPRSSSTILGPASFATPTFIKEFQQHLQEQIQPGYYSDGIYVSSPFLKEIAPREAQTFTQAYTDAYHSDPTWIAAAYYDAARVAVEAIRLAEIDSDDPTFRKRKKIQDALVSLSEPEVAIQGVTGSLYFDQYRNVNQALAIGHYMRQQLLPAYLQFQLFREGEQSSNFMQTFFQFSSQKENLFSLGDGNVVKEVQVVNTGVDINTISRLDLRDARYTLDFYIWFRFKKEFDDTAITFLNAESPITLGSPILEETLGDVTLRSYHVKGDFTTDIDVRKYPFERPILRLMFSHDLHSTSSLRYVPDVVGMPPSQPQQNAGFHLIEPATGWSVQEISSYQRVQNDKNSTASDLLLNPTQVLKYSQFHTDIRLVREDLTFLLKTLLPLAILLLLLYTGYFIPPRHLGIRSVICATTVLLTIAYHYQARQRFDFPVPYILNYDLAAGIVYGLGLLALIHATVSYSFNKQQRKMGKILSTILGRLLHLLVFISAIGGLVYIMVQEKLYTNTILYSFLSKLLYLPK